MSDWGPVVISAVLFVLLSPGLLFQLPAHQHIIKFGSMQTSGAAILVHSIIFFAILAVFLIAIGVRITTG
jgi:putative exporter of polyketide antibiotics